MSLRHEDDPPPLTAAQQAEVIRLAAHLQAEHEANSTEGMFEAAEEAGIDRVFLQKAISQLSASRSEANAPTQKPHAVPFRVESHLVACWSAAMLLCGGLSFWVFGPLTVPFLFAVGLYLGVSIGRNVRPVWAAPVFVIAAWLLMTLFFALCSQLCSGNTGMIDGRFFLWAAFHQTLFVVLGSAVGRLSQLRRFGPQSQA